MTLMEARDLLHGACLAVDCLSAESPDKVTPTMIKITTANYLAIEALERQVPLPPCDKEYPNGAITHHCPSCGEEIDWHPNFCGECGQAFDWSEWFSKNE